MSVYIGAATTADYSAMRGPCPEGFHVPRSDDWQAVIDMMEDLGYTEDTQKAGVFVYNLWMPLSGRRDYVDGSGKTTTSKSQAMYWCCTDTNRCLEVKTSAISFKNYAKGYGFLLRPFKDEAVAPDGTWDRIDTGTGNGGIYHSKYLSLISISGNGTNWITIADKNLGATTVFDSTALNSATYTQDTCGYYFQRGNNCPFPKSAAATTMSTQVDASTYGPGNYYSSPIFRTTNQDWSSVTNSNLRGGETGLVQVPKELEAAYIGEYDCIEYKMNADSNGNLYVPVSGYNRSNSVSYINCSYDWYVSVDGGTPTNYTGTGSKGGSITLSGYTAGSSHIIKITPKTMAYGWALAYGRYMTQGASNVTEVYHDGGYKGYGLSAANASICYKHRQFYGCTALTKAPDEILPTTVTTIGNRFRDEQYYGCTALVNAPAEVLPNTVTSIGDYFRYHQYYGCTALQAAPTEVFVNSLTTIGTYFRSGQYYGCTSLIVPSVEVISNNLTTVGTYFRGWQYYNCGILAAAVPEVLPSTVTTIGNYFRLYQYYGCSSILAATNEVLPSGVTTIGTDFRNGQYYNCTSLETASAEVLPNTVTSIGEKFRSSQYYGCTSLIAAATEVFPNTITTIGRDFRYSQYEGCSSLITPSIEVLPSSVTSVGYQFRANQYRGCTSLTTTPVEVFPSTITSAGANFRNWQYCRCTALTTVSGILNSDTCTFASGDFRGQQFFGCTSNKVVTVLSDIGPAAPNANALQNSYVTTVRVPSAYLNNFVNATTYPWSDIDDSKFIGY